MILDAKVSVTRERTVLKWERLAEDRATLESDPSA